MAEMTERVRSIHKDLGCELTSGLKSRHAFTISARGNRAIRPLAQKWLAAAPVPDATWEYHSARPAGHRPHAEFGGLVLAEEDYLIVFRVDERLRRLDLTAFHPAYMGMPESKRLVCLSLFLCDLLGEDDAERWIGQFEATASPSTGAIGTHALLAEIEHLRGLPATTGATIIQGFDAKKRPISVVADLQMKRIDHLLQNQHGSVTIPLAGDWPPPGADLEALDTLEECLTDRLEGTATWAARTTRPGRRTIHLVAQDAAAAGEIVEAWIRENPNLHATTTWQSDPEWSFRAEWDGENEASARPTLHN
jgi:hypothetical protein